MHFKMESVNKKQMFALLYKFMLENRIARDWYKMSIEFKTKNEYGRAAWKGVWDAHNITEDDDFKTHLEKCIDIYFERDRYAHTVYGFFTHIPTSFSCTAMRIRGNKWTNIADKWKSKYGYIKLNINDENDKGTS